MSHTVTIQALVKTERTYGEGNDAGALHGVSNSGEEFVLPELNI